MLFNSAEFVFLFLPVVVTLHFALARWRIEAAVVGTTLSSLAFYGWWSLPYVALPVLSIAANFWLGERIVRSGNAAARSLLIGGVIANLLLLGYFKYTDFIVSVFDGHKLALPSVPLALSFTTFVQIGYLVYVHRQRPKVDFAHYALFVSFFPHLIAGPIVRWGSFGHQLADQSRYRLDWSNIALGLTVFSLGLAKKVVIADALSPYVQPVFAAAARGEAQTALAAWGGAIAFITQIYFDFSGYSEMAIGLGLLFNFKLPINFAAPLRATSIADLWRRWHITLARLCRDLIYVPLARGGGALYRGASLLLTMTVVGLWHGAGWTFIVWGAFNGVLLLINIAWSAWRGPRTRSRLANGWGWVLTFASFAIGGVFFRAEDIGAAWRILVAMAGLANAPAPITLSHESDDWFIAHGLVTKHFVESWIGDTWSLDATGVTFIAIAIMLWVPDTIEIVNYRQGDAQSNWRRSAVKWRPSPAWAGICAAIATAAVVSMSRVQEFLYYQF
jgi:alginate O-acetyltransferase complex protein AlgI